MIEQMNLAGSFTLPGTSITVHATVGQQLMFWMWHISTGLHWKSTRLEQSITPLPKKAWPCGISQKQLAKD